jgi:hypothetical protein
MMNQIEGDGEQHMDNNSFDDVIGEGRKKAGTKLCARGKAAAKSKFKVYPSAYSNGFAVQVCQGRMKGLDGKKRCGTYTNSLSFNVYPNPSISNFKVNISTEELGEITLQVFDVLGKMVHQEKGQSDKLYNFGLNFKPGFYVVKVIQANQFMTSKIIKQ